MAGASDTRLAVVGVAGRMGRRVAALAAQTGCRITVAVARAGHADLGRTLAELGLVPAGQPGAEVALRELGSLGDTAAAFDVCLDFSAPDALPALVRACQHAKRPLVTGTTGLTPHHEALIDEAAGTVAVLHATNFSLGVALLTDLARQAAAALGPEFEIEIVEAHHGRKVDAPSGTALTLAHAAAAGRGLTFDEHVRHGRVGQVGPRDPREIGMHAVRGGTVVGEHTVLYLGPDERLELTHRAASRDIFVRGALHCCRWLAHQPPGRYAVGDALGRGQNGTRPL